MGEGRMTDLQASRIPFRQRVDDTLSRPLVRNLITGIIIFNALLLGLLTYRDKLPPGLVAVLDVCDYLIAYIFAAEIVLHLYAERMRYFSKGWNVFDFIIVAISLIPGAKAFSVLRAMRVLRLFRLLHIVPMMRRISEALLKALPGMGAIGAVLALVIYVGAVMATMMFGGSSDPQVHRLFGDLPSSALSLFQVMTGDGWRDVMQVVMEDGNPYAWIFFLIFIFIASFAILNLFIGLIVDALAEEQKAMISEQITEELTGTFSESISEIGHDIEDKVEEEIGDIEDEIHDLERVDQTILVTLTEMRAEIAALRVLIAARS
jgi:voltage-gated sodium channel